MNDIFLSSPSWFDSGAMAIIYLVMLTGWVVVGGLCLRFMSWFIFRYLLKRLQGDYQYFRGLAV